MSKGRGFTKYSEKRPEKEDMDENRAKDLTACKFDCRCQRGGASRNTLRIDL